MSDEDAKMPVKPFASDSTPEQIRDHVKDKDVDLNNPKSGKKHWMRQSRRIGKAHSHRLGKTPIASHDDRDAMERKSGEDLEIVNIVLTHDTLCSYQHRYPQTIWCK